jgi:type III secretion system low calcium response chaperone LcrH/SycD
MNLNDLIQEAKKAPPLDTEAFYTKAYAHYQANQPDLAAEIFTVLCTRQPMEKRYWFGLGASLQESKNYEKALYAWAMTALLDPENPYPHFHAAECSDSLEQYNDALLAIREAQNRVSDPQHPLYAPIALLEEQWRKRCPA